MKQIHGQIRYNLSSGRTTMNERSIFDTSTSPARTPRNGRLNKRGDSITSTVTTPSLLASRMQHRHATTAFAHRSTRHHAFTGFNIMVRYKGGSLDGNHLEFRRQSDSRSTLLNMHSHYRHGVQRANRQVQIMVSENHIYSQYSTPALACWARYPAPLQHVSYTPTRHRRPHT